jgi:hypothetical protein
MGGAARRVFLGGSVLVCVAVAVYAQVSVGRFTGANAFLVLAAATLCGVVALLFRAARALVEDAGSEEVRVATGRRRKELEREKASLLKALKELEFDHEMGKVSEADFREIGGQYRARAVRVLRQLDAEGGDYKALIARDVKAKLAGGAPARAAAPAPDPFSAPARAKEPSEAAAPASARPSCPACATANDADAEFCKKCGKKLEAVRAAAT